MVPYQEDLRAAFAQAQEQAFQEGASFWWTSERPRPRTLAELWKDEVTRHDGTHSLLDMACVLEPGAEPELGAVVPVSAEAVLRLFGTARPTRADYERERGELHGEVPERRHGCCAILYDGDRPSEIAFWGVSGVLCVNPAALLAGTAPGATTPLRPYLPTRRLLDGNLLMPGGSLSPIMGFTPTTYPTGFAAYEDLATGACSQTVTSKGRLDWLQVNGLDQIKSSSDVLGLHVLDYNVDAGGLSALVAAQAAAWQPT
ncbi:hypothetical protein AB0L05_20945 [Nonomuraea pusilla]|uniref:hypothetical protein n=1 Tax=Nonomuraea pusilla TaxID=46177 RepID=UPI003316EF83